MWQEHDVVQADLEHAAAADFLPWHRLHGKTVLVTGAAGLIGSALTKTLLWYSMRQDAGLRVLALARDRAAAERVFDSPLAAGAPLRLLIADVTDVEDIDEDVDFLVHGASITSSKMFVQKPVETIRTSLLGTERMLALARQKQVESVVYLSSMEVYGAPQNRRRITEVDFDHLDPMQVRSSYPESKRMAECLCAAYAAEYGVPAKVLRLTQTFGPGVAPDDNRVFAEFARSAITGRDIVLRTTGETERSYLYTADAVTSALAVLLEGEVGQAYHAANESTYCSVRQMADLVAATAGPAPVSVRVEPQEIAASGFAPTLTMNLDTAKIRSLGWRPEVGLEDMYRRMIATM